MATVDVARGAADVTIEQAELRRLEDLAEAYADLPLGLVLDAVRASVDDEDPVTGVRRRLQSARRERAANGATSQ